MYFNSKFIISMKTLVLVRGIPGAGKTTFAQFLSQEIPVISADDYFYDKDKKYLFNIEELNRAHMCSQLCAETMMEKNINKICVANTFTTQKEMQPYFDLANKYGYRVFSIIIENRHGNSSIHNVPDETIINMKKRFNITL